MEDEEGVEEDDDDSESKDEEEDEEDEEPDLELRSKIEEALRASGIEPADHSEGDDDDGSEEEEIVDDDQMMAIDEQLAEIFRSRVSERKGGKGVVGRFRSNLFALIHTSFRCQCST
jgi:DNA polymerase phi